MIRKTRVVPYCSVDDVVERIVVDPSQREQFKAEYGEDIESKIRAADALIDARLAPYINTPLNPTPPTIRYVSADIAAALYTMDRGEYQKAKAIIDRAEEALQAYIKTTQKGAFTATC